MSATVSVAIAAPLNSAALKRRSPSLNNGSSSSPFDCLSLQSSLKRVRLSCSPGELRLRRDVQTLAAMEFDWELVSTDDDDDDRHSPYYQWRHRPSRALLTQQDPLSLQLRFPSKTATTSAAAGESTQYSDSSGTRVWIQIPRMYPHRPPVVARIENSWIERVVVQELPPSVVHGSLRPTICETTVVYNQWSPVLHIGDLLEFLITTASLAPPISRLHGDLHDATASLMEDDYDNDCCDHGDPRRHAHLTRRAPSSSKFAIECFVEEYKMDDAAATDVVLQQPPREGDPSFNRTTCRSGTPPNLVKNRFDVGYGKYQDPLLTTLNRNDMMEMEQDE